MPARPSSELLCATCPILQGDSNTRSFPASFVKSKIPYLLNLEPEARPTAIEAIQMEFKIRGRQSDERAEMIGVCLTRRCVNLPNCTSANREIEY